MTTHYIYAGLDGEVTGAVVSCVEADLTGVHTHDPSLWPFFLLRDVSILVGWSYNGSAWVAGSPPPALNNYTRTIGAAARVFDFALPTDAASFALNILGVQHTGASARALAVAFSTDDRVTFGVPVPVGALVAAATDINIDLTFFSDPDAPRNLTSSALGFLGLVVPAGANGMCIGAADAIGFADTVDAGAFTLSWS